MNIQKQFPLPEFVLLDGENHKGEQLEGRTVILHIPTNSYFEVVAVDEENEHAFDAIEAKFPFKFKNADGEDEKHFLLLHGTQADAELLSKIYVTAAQWYGSYAIWIDDEVSKL